MEDGRPTLPCQLTPLVSWPVLDTDHLFTPSWAFQARVALWRWCLAPGSLPLLFRASLLPLLARSRGLTG
eukprot:9319002-Pyramimonas_sp.AAC.1